MHNPTHNSREDRLEAALDAVWRVADAATRAVADGTACFAGLRDALASICCEAAAALEGDGEEESAA